MNKFHGIGRIAAIAAAVALTATPAFAASNDPTTSTPKQERAAPKASSEAQKYCVEDQVTGSRLKHRTCKTRAEWISEDGFDPLSRN